MKLFREVFRLSKSIQKETEIVNTDQGIYGRRVAEMSGIPFCYLPIKVHVKDVKRDA